MVEIPLNLQMAVVITMIIVKTWKAGIHVICTVTQGCGKALEPSEAGRCVFDIEDGVLRDFFF
jgi:hypothetical protein